MTAPNVAQELLDELNQTSAELAQAELRTKNLRDMLTRIWAEAVSAQCGAAIIADKIFSDSYVEAWITQALKKLQPALEVINQIQWVEGGVDGEPIEYCPVCGELKQLGHQDNCALAALLSKKTLDG